MMGLEFISEDGQQLVKGSDESICQLIDMLLFFTKATTAEDLTVYRYAERSDGSISLSECQINLWPDSDEYKTAFDVDIHQGVKDGKYWVI